ncbi:MAG: CopG family transcriptional regulator [Lentimicrobiaceae bacterium]|nr:CopG family transcriptional regulator [Lentimicrobiaceae bacterium]
MEKRIGAVIIEIEKRENASLVNQVISKHSEIILGRQGLPRSNKNSIISLILEGTTDEIGSLTGQLGRIDGIEVKSALLKCKSND